MTTTDAIAPVRPEDARRIAADGWVWGFALVENYRTMYPQAIDADDHRYVGGFGTFRHYPQPFTPANTDVVTPNNDTPYSWAWLDLRTEPWVLSVPATDRYHVLPLHDLDTPYVGFIGSRTTGDSAGDYLVTGPGRTGPVPDGLAGVLRADTQLVGILGRAYLAGPQDVDALKAVQQQYLLRPLSEFTDAERPEPAVEPQWPVWREEARESVEFFTYLDFLLQFVPVREDVRRLRADLARLGIDGTGSFEPGALSPELREALAQGMDDGRARLREAEAAHPSSAGLFGTRAELGDDFLLRAVGVDKGLYGLPTAEAWYGGWLTDTAGNRPPNAAARDYTVHFTADQLPKARFFWSATLYRLPERLLVDNPIDRYSIGDRTPGLVYDADGGLTLYVQHTRPADPDQAANWLPAPAGPFTVITRIYGPASAVLDGTWQLPDLTAAPDRG
ncbi:DUF1254 domain-containing protein [Streptacidiphilus sp. N1-12]|uniref:DUF1254 domain-containing protein n=2 Tax=Streptacidiphilus alkalitolerans TaxID=3342712 RepID=A0ABV6WM65_9ACTN